MKRPITPRALSADVTAPASPTPTSPAPVPRQGSGAPLFMQPAYQRRRNVGRSHR